MRPSLRLIAAASLVLAVCSSPLLADDDSDGSTDRLDDAWAERALAHPDLDRGWSQSSDRWSDGRAPYHEVREFSWPRDAKPLAIDGGANGGMTVMGSNREQVRILYRVTVRARSEERAREIAAQVQVERKDGWLRSRGPETTRDAWWDVEVKAWAPRATDLVLKTNNGPLAVRDVRSRMDLSSINGPMSLEDLGGAVQARTQNGPLHVALSGTRWDGSGLDAEAENGPLDFEVPSDYSARVITGTINGPRASDYAIESGHGRSWIQTTLGKGGPLVRVVTTNGPFHMGER